MTVQQLEAELFERTWAIVNSLTPEVALGDAEALAEALADAEADFEGVGVGVTLIATPLFHTRLVPLLMHVNRLPW